ncbi:MAG: hypothetical protein NW218_19440 [Saprospiraceae bacterium]|nr:hypothetical protein [Saprospiraceae bacterium]
MVPQIISGGIHMDSRGSLIHMNSFDMKDVKRFYIITPSNIDEIRAWQGHKIEDKWFFAIRGSFIIASVCPDHWESPSMILPVNQFRINAENPEVLYFPAGLANGFKALEPDSSLLVFSNKTLEEAKHDDFRFPNHFWFNFIT